jgi:iron complex outermembrane receptor protein
VELTYLGAIQDLSDRRLPNVPKFAYTVALDAARPLGSDHEVYLRADYLHRSTTNSTPTLSAYGVIPAYGVLNLRVGLRTADGKYDLSFFARNLTDEKYYLARSASPLGSITASPGEPRTIGGTLRVKL